MWVTFDPTAPNGEAVRALLQRILDWLPSRQREQVGTERQRLQLDLRRRDRDVLDQQVFDILGRAYRERRRLRFLYRAPGNADGLPRRHTVEPWEPPEFEAGRGHYYLTAYCVEIAGPGGESFPPQWRRYRVGRILPEGIELLPDRLPPTPPKRPRIRLEYLLSPAIARFGEVTQHFEKMQVAESDAEGWVRVTAETDDLFRAVQILLSYGGGCRVVGGREARRALETHVAAMSAWYGAASSTGGIENSPSGRGDDVRESEE